MSTRYQFIDNNAVYFTTSTVVGWTDIFTREMYKTILLDSVRHCQQSEDLKIHTWVLMTNPARMTGRTGIYIPFVVVKKGSITTNTIYVRDASGNIMAVYTKDAAINSGSLTQTEISMYGSSRLGVWNPNRNVASLAAIDYAAYSSTFIRGNKGFELTNHLGNVLVTVSDKKIGHDAGNGTIDYYTADVVTANDYTPFGSLMTGRKYLQVNSKYRYGFNGQEKDNDMKGEGNSLDFGARVYDPRLGRFLSIDKFTGATPFYSPYNFAGNKPTIAIDHNGNVEIIVTYHKTDRNGKLSTTTSKYIIETVEDIRGITRDAYKIDVYQKETLMSQTTGNRIDSWYGWQTSFIKQDKESGKSPEERNYPGVGGWIAKNLYKLVVKTNPVAKFGDATGYNRDQVTGEYKDPARARLQAAEAVFEMITLGRGAIAEKGLEKVLGKYIIGKLKDYAFEQTITLATKQFGLDKAGILGYHLTKLVIDGNAGKLNDIYKLLSRGSSVDGKIMDAEKQLRENFGIDLDPPKDGKAAVKKALKSE